jgi:hypothetical protein
MKALLGADEGRRDGRSPGHRVRTNGASTMLAVPEACRAVAAVQLSKQSCTPSSTVW